MNDRQDWFASKRYGLGAGLPISWQGWAVSAAFVGSVAAAVDLVPDRPLAVLAIIVPITLLFLIICARTTRGGWRWRWGRDD